MIFKFFLINFTNYSFCVTIFHTSFFISTIFLTLLFLLIVVYNKRKNIFLFQWMLTFFFLLKSAWNSLILIVYTTCILINFLLVFIANVCVIFHYSQKNFYFLCVCFSYRAVTFQFLLYIGRSGVLRYHPQVF